MEKQMRKIVIVRGDEFKVHDNEIAQNEDIFEEIYQKAGEKAEQLMKYTAGICEKAGAKGQENWEREMPAEYLNNIIAFCGERGQGKSTAMLHFVEGLKAGIGGYDDRLDRLAPYGRMEVLRVIDPTALEMSHDIVDIIISQLFEQFRGDRELDKGQGTYKNGNLDKGKDMELTQAFQKVHRSMSVLKNAQTFIEQEYAYNGSLQNLSDITDSMELRKDIIRLVELYLSYRKKDMLVVPIDDLDLNLNHVYKVAEQLRKYFMIPRLMIVMAANTDQMTLCVEGELLKSLAPLKESRRWDIRREARNMSNRYMEKLIPFSRRMQLPDIHAIAEDGENTVQIVYQDRWLPGENGEKERVLFDSEELGIEKGILNLIFRKTGLVYVAKPNEVHPIVPHTLRELVNLISLLGDMEDVQKEGQEENQEEGVAEKQGESQEDTQAKSQKSAWMKSDGTVQVENLETFEQYFRNVWLENNLSDKNAEVLRQIAGTRLNNLHNDAFLLLYKMEERKLKRFRGLSVEADPLAAAVDRAYERMLKGEKTPDNGDMLNCLRMLQQGERSDVSRLVMAVMTVFSIRMLKLKAAGQKAAEQKVPGSWEVLYDFIGENIFGEYRLIRGKALKDRVVTDRMRFPYQVRNVMEYLKEDSITPFSVASVKTKFNYRQLALLLVVLGCSSEFMSKDGTSRRLVANNHQVAEKAEFDINQLFLSGLSWEKIKEKISLEKWVDGREQITDVENAFRSEYDSIYQTDAWGSMVCNMEELMCLAQYAEENRDYKEAANEGDYYSHFFENVTKFQAELHTYLSGLKVLEKSKIRDCVEITVLLKQHGMEREDGNSAAQYLKCPGRCQQNTHFRNLVDRLEKLKKYLQVVRVEEIGGKSYFIEKDFDEALSQRIDQLFGLAAQFDADAPIGPDLAAQYNELRKDVIDRGKEEM